MTPPPAAGTATPCLVAAPAAAEIALGFRRRRLSNRDLFVDTSSALPVEHTPWVGQAGRERRAPVSHFPAAKHAERVGKPPISARPGGRRPSSPDRVQWILCLPSAPRRCVYLGQYLAIGNLGDGNQKIAVVQELIDRPVGVGWPADKSKSPGGDGTTMPLSHGFGAAAATGLPARHFATRTGAGVAKLPALRSYSAAHAPTFADHKMGEDRVHHENGSHRCSHDFGFDRTMGSLWSSSSTKPCVKG